jgi:hypothetical protein
MSIAEAAKINKELDSNKDYTNVAAIASDAKA